MARSRSIPVALLKEPDFFELSPEARVVFIGLILEADDEGRGRAHAGLLARLFNVSEAAVEEALSQLVERGLLLRYQVGRQSYYQWLPWKQWQSLSKPTPSQLPPPPVSQVAEPEPAANLVGNPQENPGKPGAFLPEEEGEGEEEEEGEKERGREGEREEEGEGDGAALACEAQKIVPFPRPAVPPRSAPSSAGASAEALSLCQEIAEILGIPLSRQLRQVIEEFAATIGWSAVLGEAVECIEYIQDPRRNQKQQRLTPGFFRRWLKRVQGGQPPGPGSQAASEPRRTSGARSQSEDVAAPARAGRRARVPEPAWDGSDPMAQYRAYVEAQRQAWEAACQAETQEPGAVAGGS